MARNVEMAVPVRPPDARPMGTSEKLEYAIKTITPMFGGGVEPGKSDLVRVVRVPEVRGHLRFWWRAIRGQGLTVSELREKEGQVWGSTDMPSPVVVEVEIGRSGTAVDWKKQVPNRRGEMEWRVDADNFPGYALFPFQEVNRPGRPPKPRDKGLAGVEFSLRIWAPDDKKLDVEAAVWAWVNFGGIGARTRRGCGALFCKACAPPSQDAVKEWFDRNLALYRTKGPNVEVAWPELRWRPILHQQSQTPTAAWVRAVGALGDYRQKPGIGRSSGSGPKPGRSFWPEADSFRALNSDCADPNHLPSTTIQPASPPQFPRALFGLPIVFQLRGEGFGDAIQLQPAVSDGEKGAWRTLDRMASPLLLRPLAVGDGTKARAMAMLLRAPEPQGVALKNDNLPDHGWDATHLKGPHTQRYATSPIRRFSTDVDALSGFFGYLMTSAGFVAL